MTSRPKADNPKRANPPRRSDRTKQFLKDWERLTRSGRYNMRQLKEAMLLLIANDGPLPAEWLDHPLTGDWVDHRECHIGGDFLLIYRLSGSGASEDVIFVRAGTHADLFEN
jgi:mRNA interferase YafQ